MMMNYISKVLQDTCSVRNAVPRTGFSQLASVRALVRVNNPQKVDQTRENLQGFGTERTAEPTDVDRVMIPINNKRWTLFLALLVGTVAFVLTTCMSDFLAVAVRVPKTQMPVMERASASPRFHNFISQHTLKNRHILCGPVLRAGISSHIDKAKFDGFSLQTVSVEDDAIKRETVQTLANWYLEVVMDEDFATGRTKERQLLQAFKKSVENGSESEKLLMLLADDNPTEPVAMLIVEEWDVRSIVLSPLVQAQKPAKKLLSVLESAAEMQGTSLGLPAQEALIPFGLETK